MYVWYGWLLGALAVAAILGQREAQVILFLWVAWPIVKGLLLAIPKAFNNLQKRKEEKEEAIEAEVWTCGRITPSGGRFPGPPVRNSLTRTWWRWSGRSCRLPPLLGGSKQWQWG